MDGERGSYDCTSCRQRHYVAVDAATMAHYFDNQATAKPHDRCGVCDKAKQAMNEACSRRRK